VAIIGVSLGHDSSAALTSENGEVISAVGEERISRIKSHAGIPLLSIEALLKNSDSEVTEVIFGTHRIMTIEEAKTLIVQGENNPSNPKGLFLQAYPGFARRNVTYFDPHELIKSKMVKEFPELNKANFVWINHHDSHLGCALGNVHNDESALLVSLDGQGDGESAAIASYLNGSINVISRTPQLDSLGNLYTAVTERYNFQRNKHEGKITGLAAYGSFSAAVEVLSHFVAVKNGVVRIKNAKNLRETITGTALRKIGFESNIGRNLDQIVSIAESQTCNYPDLAFAVQEILEKSVLEIINYWTLKTQLKKISLAGGVFANVKLNQRISEHVNVDSIKVFPNMGDGGVSLGSIWSHLRMKNSLSPRPLYESMYLGPETEDSDSQTVLDLDPNEFEVAHFEDFGELTREIAGLIYKNKTVAIHDGLMEFGPRALGNRSLLVDPRSKENIAIVNRKLRRTEFMPFAPVVPLEFFYDYFDISGTQELQPFFYMTCTCDVKKTIADKIPGVVHIDGTARPQIVTSESNNRIYTIIKEFHKLSGIAVLVNTSLNIHEEPINYRLVDSIHALKSDAMDFLNYNNYLIYKK
jgi:carbamoyltransferase